MSITATYPGADANTLERTTTQIIEQQLRGIDVELAEASELTPVVVALCALADGESRIRGVAHIRGHETDRIAALAAGR